MSLSIYAQSLLDCVQVTLDEAGVPVCTAYLSPAPQPTLDNCCSCATGGEGQLTVSLVSSVPVQPFYGQPCGRDFEVSYLIGLTRCAHTLNEDGSPPSPAQIQEDANKVYRDQRLLLNAVTCCWVEELQLDPEQWSLGPFSAQPQGGCLFMQLEVLTRTPDCSDCL